MFQKSLVTAFQASVDYTSDKGLQTIFGTVKNKKSLTDAITEFVASGSVNKVFGNFNTQLEKAFAKKGLKGQALTNAIGTVLKSESDFLENTLKTVISEETKSALDEKDKTKQ